MPVSARCLSLGLVALSSLTLACGTDHEPGHGEAALSSGPGRAPQSGQSRPIQWPTRPPPERAEAPTPSAEEQAAATEELDEKRAALADVGRAAFDALREGDFDALLALTPLSDPGLAEDCGDMTLSSRKELKARFDHCYREIPWEEVEEAQVFAGEPSGRPAAGCAEGVEDYGRLQLFLHMRDETIWRVQFFGAVGREGKAIGIDGAVRCATVDEAPQLR